MRKIVALVAILLLVSASVYAQPSPRNASNINVLSNGQIFHNKTNFTSISVQGNDFPGNAGYIEFISPGSEGVDNNKTFSYFLWVGVSGKLRLASHTAIIAAIGTGASFPTGNWASRTSVGTIVGTQN